MSPRIVNTYDPQLDRSRSYDLEKSHDMARYIVRHPFAWPGGYELCLITDDGGTLCRKCVRDNYRLIYHSGAGDGWHVIALVCCSDIEDGICDNCGEPLNPEVD